MSELSHLLVKILEVAKPHNDTEESGDVFMPDEEEWGIIVGMARELCARFKE